MDKRIILLVVFSLVVGVSLGLLLNYYKSQQTINLNGIELKRQNYETINDFVKEKEYVDYFVCDLDTEQCNYMINVENYEKVIN